MNLCLPVKPSQELTLSYPTRHPPPFASTPARLPPPVSPYLPRSCRPSAWFPPSWPTRAPPSPAHFRLFVARRGLHERPAPRVRLVEPRPGGAGDEHLEVRRHAQDENQGEQLRSDERGVHRARRVQLRSGRVDRLNSRQRRGALSSSSSSCRRCSSDAPAVWHRPAAPPPKRGRRRCDETGGEARRDVGPHGARVGPRRCGSLSQMDPVTAHFRWISTWRQSWRHSHPMLAVVGAPSRVLAPRRAPRGAVRRVVPAKKPPLVVRAASHGDDAPADASARRPRLVDPSNESKKRAATAGAKDMSRRASRAAASASSSAARAGARAPSPRGASTPRTTWTWPTSWAPTGPRTGAPRDGGTSSASANPRRTRRTANPARRCTSPPRATGTSPCGST